jgi:hypothetical protein
MLEAFSSVRRNAQVGIEPTSGSSSLFDASMRLKRASMSTLPSQKRQRSAVEPNVSKEYIRSNTRRPLHDIVVQINDKLQTQGLPEWLIHATDKDLKKRAQDRGEYDDMMNEPGSCLFLAMLTPQQFGIDATPLFPLLQNDDLLFISYTKSRSGKGIDNRRTNCIEALLNDLKTEDEMKAMLQNAWKMAYRAFYLESGADDKSMDQFDLTKRLFACMEPLDDEVWWQQARRDTDRIFAKSEQDETASHLQQEAQAIFDRILTQIQDVAKRGEHITYKLLATIAGFDGHKGKTVKRLYILWDAHCRADSVIVSDAADSVIVAGAVTLIPAASVGTASVYQNWLMQQENICEHHISCDQAHSLWEQLTYVLKADGLDWTDLPAGDELTAVLQEMQFSAMQRMHLQKMLSRTEYLQEMD